MNPKKENEPGIWGSRLAFFHNRQKTKNSFGAPLPTVNKRMKNFLSHSRERLDNFVGKFSSKKNEQNGLESAASVGAGLGMGFNPLGGFELDL